MRLLAGMQITDEQDKKETQKKKRRNSVRTLNRKTSNSVTRAARRIQPFYVPQLQPAVTTTSQSRQCSPIPTLLQLSLEPSIARAQLIILPSLLVLRQSTRI
ncbi:hypothetical protein CRV24_005969 [Beauveria bassiana]|nr:hypothetical protein CRV24_005969 [Beauveria bassiana]